MKFTDEPLELDEYEQSLVDEVYMKILQRRARPDVIKNCVVCQKEIVVKHWDGDDILIVRVCSDDCWDVINRDIADGKI